MADGERNDRLQRVEADIRYYEHELERLGGGVSQARDLARLQVIRLLLRQRRQLRAALLNDDEDNWPNYAPESNDAPAS